MTSDYFGGDITINYSYLGVSIAILIIIYFMLYSTKSVSHNKNLYDDDINKNIISVKTYKGNTMIEPNIFEMYIKNFKLNISELVNLKFKNKDKVKNSIMEAKKVLESYIKENIGFYKTGNTIYKECEFDSHIKTQMSDADDEIKILLLELLSDLDMIIFIIRSSYKKGTFDLTVIDRLVSDLYNNDCLISIDLFGSDIEKKTMLNFIPDNLHNWSEKNMSNVPAVSRMSELSHDININPI